MNVWIVDDDELFHMLVKRIAVKSNSTSSVVSFYHGREASERLKELSDVNQYPDVIILDINMPLYDGWYFMHEFAQMPSEVKNHVRVYICSSSIAPDDRKRADDDTHVKGFIEKPITADVYLKTISNKQISA